MTERPRVTEVIATTALVIDIPIDHGEDPTAGVKLVLEELETVRNVVTEDVGEISSGNGHLSVEVYARVTFHFDPDAIDEATQRARNLLETTDSIESVTTLDIESGPYRIEAW